MQKEDHDSMTATGVLRPQNGTYTIQTSTSHFLHIPPDRISNTVIAL